ncbi:hypothetical protein QOZ80_8BG0659480 [Eleusine coracana subsp. coracana]|nr:hypothetical protein QOZ80_8BG0659480 [Eleusine coracana subsp. coracana]
MGNPRFRLHPTTLNPPELTSDDDDAAAEYPPWVLLESDAYVAKRENSTTAFSKTWDNKDIQILAIKEHIIVLRITVSCQKDFMENIDYYVYQAADGAAGWKPSLTLLERPPGPYNSFYPEQTGVVLYETTSHKQPGFYMRPHSHGERSYLIAALKALHWEVHKDFPPGTFMLCLYNSEKGSWSFSTVFLNQQQVNQYKSSFEHTSSMVVTIGGDTHTVGFVDLRRGILFCDLPVIGEVIPPLRYLELPSPKNLPSDEARLARDIVVVKDQLKFVELQVHWKKSIMCKGQWYEDGWVAATWTRPANCFTGSWCKEQVVDTKTMNFKDNPYLKLLPKVRNDEDMVLPPFKRISVCQPIFGDDSILYLMAKFRRQDDNGWIVAVDMNSKSLIGVAPSIVAINRLIPFSYTHSRVSQYLPKTAPGACPLGHLKRLRGVTSIH